MKKGIIVLLIMVMVTGFAFADSVPTFSGEVKAGYTLYMGHDAEAYSWNNKTGELKLTMTFVGDYWKINVKSLGQMDTKGALDANVEMDVDKLVNMGDFKLNLSAGNNKNTQILSSFNDWKDDSYYKLKIAGSETNVAAKITAAYKAVKLQFAMDPTNASTNFGGAYSISAKADINDGINVSAGYVYNAKTTAIGKDTRGKKSYTLDWYARNAIGASFSIDIAKLANLDGKFKISFYDNILLGLGLSPITVKDVTYGLGSKEKEGNANELAFNIEGGTDKLTADIEFRAMNGKYTNEKYVELVESDRLDDYGLRAQVKYAFNENWGAKINGGLDSFDFKNGYGCWDLGGGFNFKIFNVDFGWQSYAANHRDAGLVNFPADKGEFTIQPYFDFKF